jgi:hypothetical protein
MVRAYRVADNTSQKEERAPGKRPLFDEAWIQSGESLGSGEQKKVERWFAVMEVVVQDGWNRKENVVVEDKVSLERDVARTHDSVRSQNRD